MQEKPRSVDDLPPETRDLAYRIFGDLIMESRAAALASRRRYYLDRRDRLLVYSWARIHLEKRGDFYVWGLPRSLGRVTCPVCGRPADGYIQEIEPKGEREGPEVARIYRHPENRPRDRYHVTF